MLFLFSLTLWVDTTGVEGESLQTAIDYLATVPGIDTVILRDGTYHLTINPDVNGIPQGLFLKDSLVFMSENGAEKCTLTAYHSDTPATHVIVCDNGATSLWIKGFTIKDACDYLFRKGISRGSGIFADSSSPWIEDCIIENNDSYGIYAMNTPSGKEVILVNTIIQNNVGAIYARNTSLFLKHTKITNNWREYTDVIVLDSSFIMIFGGEISDCGTWGGAIIDFSNSSGFFKQTVFYSNRNATPAGRLISAYGSDLAFNHCIFAGNLTGFHSDSSKITAESLFVIDNGGVVTAASNWDTVEISYSDLLFNTYQADTEFYNNSLIPFNLENNYWFYTDSSSIQSLIYGPADFIPFADDFISGLPSGPSYCSSFGNYYSDYTTPCDSVGQGDILYLLFSGDDSDLHMREVVPVLIRSSCYPGGVVVTLLETDTSSGVYKGTAVPVERAGQGNIRTDDIFQRIGVNTSDTMFIRPLFFSFPEIAVVYNAPRMGVRKKDTYTVVCGDVLKLPFTIKNRNAVIYDVAGRERRVGVRERTLNLTGLPSGIYFLKYGGKSLKIVKVK